LITGIEINKKRVQKLLLSQRSPFTKDMSGSILQRGTLKTSFSQHFSPFGIQAQKGYLPLHLANSPLKKQIEKRGGAYKLLGSV
jgi:hypothetical protein